MVNEITGVGYPGVGKFGSSVFPAVASHSDPGTVPAAGSGAVTQVGTSGSQSSNQFASVYSRSQEQQTRMNQAAATVHDAGKAVQKTMDLLNQTKQSLSQITKMWPPYPAGSGEREDILNRVSGLRQMVAALTFPPSESLNQAGQAIGEPSGGVGASGVQQVVATAQSGVSGLEKLDPGSASDASVGKALSQVDALHTKLQSMSTGMWHDIAAYVARASTPEVQNQGAGTGRLLAGLNGMSVGSNAALLQQVAETK